VHRLERVAVQLWEACRFLDNGTVAYLRLALDLADGACETLLSGDCSHQLSLWHARHLGQEPPSKSRQSSIDREFEAKIDFLQEEKRLDPVHGRVLRRIHIYRNEAHHRDQVRPKTLESAVRLMLFLAAEMLEAWPPWSYAMASYDEVPGLHHFFPDSSNFGFPNQLGASFGNRAEVAAVIRTRSGISEVTGLETALSEQGAERVGELVRNLDFIAEYLRNESGRDDIDAANALSAAIKAAQDDDTPWTEGLTKKQRNQVANLTADQWKALLTNHELIPDKETPLEAFHAFADFEDALEPLETVIRQMSGWIDGYYEYLSDIARGK